MKPSLLRASAGALLLSAAPALASLAPVQAQGPPSVASPAAMNPAAMNPGASRLAATESRGAASGLATARPRRGGTLRVKVVKPPRKKRGTVVVRGPGGYRKVVHRTTRLRGLRPGRYRINARTVRARQWYAPPTVSQRRVRVRARRTRVVEVSWWNVVSRRTRALRPAQVRGYTAPATDGSTPGTLVLGARHPRGRILAVGVGPQTPYGALVRVTSARRAGTGFSHTVVLVGIDDAMPRGEFATDFAVDTGAPGPRTGLARGSGRKAHEGIVRGCGGSMNAQLTLEADAAFNPYVRARWNWFKSNVTVGVRASAWVDVIGQAQAQGSCGTGDLTIYSQPLTVIAFAVGPIPVVLVPILDISVGASVTSVGKLRYDAVANTSASAEVTVRIGAPSVNGSGPTFDGWSQFSTQARASAEAYGKARLSLMLYGLAGPYAETRVGVRGQLNPDSTPWWWTDAFFDAGMGVRIGGCVDVWFDRFCLQLEGGKPDLVKASVRLAQSSGAYPPRASAKSLLEGAKVAITEVTQVTGHPSAQGAVVGFTPGVEDYHLTTGRVDQLVGPVGQTASTAHALPGHPWLSELTDSDTFDAATTRVTLVPEGNRLRIPYVIGTEETAESGRDVVGIFVNGEDCAGTADGYVSSYDATLVNTGQLPTRYDRVSPLRECLLAVTPGVPVDVLIAVADTQDALRDTAVAVVGERITSFTQ